MVYYRKYRPQTIAELDLVDVREKLTSILSGKEIPHAFLFTGPRGLGKTSSARILAKAINCEQNQAARSEPRLERREERIKKQEARIKGKKRGNKTMIQDSCFIIPILSLVMNAIFVPR